MRREKPPGMHGCKEKGRPLYSKQVFSSMESKDLKGDYMGWHKFMSSPPKDIKHVREEGK